MPVLTCVWTSVRLSPEVTPTGPAGGGGGKMVAPPSQPRIIHGSGPSIGAPGTSTPVQTPPAKPRADDLHPEPAAPKIRAFENKMGTRHEDKWSRTPNVTGHGAIHVKSFHCKLSDDSLGYLDQQVNEWLDAHPQYEVKFVTTSIGEWSGKLGKEPHIVVQVWV